MNNIRPSCMKKSSSIRVFVDRTHRTVNEIITKYRPKLDDEAKAELSKSMCRDCGNLIGRSNYDNLFRRPRFGVVGCEELFVIMFLITLFMMLGLGLFFIRRFNRGFLYGTGGCQPNLLWTTRNCQVMA